MIKIFTFTVILTSSLISLCRILALQNYYHAPIDATLELSLKELPKRTLFKEKYLNVCYGKDWYRFPSSYLLPERITVEFIESEFNGILPAHWEPAQTTDEMLRIVKKIPHNMNDENRQERDRFVSWFHLFIKSKVKRFIKNKFLD